MIREIRDVLNGTYKRQARGNVLIGIAAGLLAGALAGLLFAPKSGKETRDYICDETKEGVKKFREKIISSGEKLSKKVEDTVDEVKKTVKKAAKAENETEKSAEIKAE